MNQVLVAHDFDADCIPANIRINKTINGVVGNMTPGLPGLNTNIVASITVPTPYCNSGGSRIAETTDAIYFIYYATRNGGYYPYQAFCNIARYDKSTYAVTTVMSLDSSNSFYTQAPAFVAAYQSATQIDIKFSGYQQDGIFSLDTDTDTTSIAYRQNYGGGPYYVPIGPALTTSLVYGGNTITTNIYPLPFSLTPGYGTDGVIGFYSIS